jgi:predicted metal-dependent HD superfamily phosphohydrolase
MADPGLNMPDITRWRGTWTELGVNEADDELFAEIMRRYAEPHRRYHTVQHLDECFAKLDEARGLAERLSEVELALWFHDAIYDVRSSDNEEQSAQWSQAAVAAAGLADAVGERVRDLILATKHDALPCSNDAALLVDVDLAILGAPAERFDEYERQVREEYSWVPGFLFKRKRREILEGFLRRPDLYTTEHFRTRYEAAARANLSRSIQQLKG